MEFIRRNKTKLVVMLVCIPLIYYFREALYTFLFLMGDREKVVALLEAYGQAGPVILALLIFAQVFLAWIPGHILMVAGGYLYGFQTAFLITAFTTIVGSQLAFALARRAGRPFVDRFVPEKLYMKWDRAADKQGAMFFLMTFWVPIFPSDLMCFVAGLGKIKAMPFFAANFIGRLPCAILLVLVGSHGYKLPVEFWAGAAVVVLLIMLGWRIFSRRFFSPDELSVANAVA